MELRIYEVFDSKERKSFEKYEKKIRVFERPCRHARPIVYLYPGPDVLLDCLTLRTRALASV